MGDGSLQKIKSLFLNSTIKQKLTVLFIIFVLYPAILVGGFGYFKYANDIKNETMKTLHSRFERAEDIVLDRFEQTRKFAMMIPYDGVLNDIFLKRKDGKLDVQGVYKNINNYLYSKFYSKQEIEAVAFCFTDNSQTVYIVDSDGSYNRYVRDIHPIILKESQKLTNQYGYYVSNDGEIYVIRQLFDRFSFKQYGVISIKIDKNYMLKPLIEEFKSSGDMIMLCDDNILVEQGHLANKAEAIQTIQTHPNGTITNHSMNHDYELICHNLTLDNITVQYGVMIPSSEFMVKYYDAMRVLVAFTSLAAIVLFIMAFPLYRAIWSPIRELVGLMRHLGEGNLGIQSSRRKKDEFDYIFETFNGMSQEIKLLFDVVYKEELARKEAQIAALQARINPHFLYNTLEIMNWKARIGGNFELSEMIEALGTLMDAGMDRGGQRICNLTDELKLVDAYMFIMNKRFGKRLEFNKSIDESAKEATIPKLIIQPLLENAMIHGLEPVGGGKVGLSVKHIENRLFIEVEDTGAGITDGELEEFHRFLSGIESTSKGSTGIGIRNVHERIQLIYGSDYGLTLLRGETGGTKASISIPFIV